MFGKEAVEFVISGKGASVDVGTASAQGDCPVIQADRHIMPQLQTLWGQACVNA